MDIGTELRETICSLLTEEPVNLLEIGPTLVMKMGYSQDAIVNALYWLVSEKRIELMSGNRVRLLEAPVRPRAAG